MKKILFTILILSIFTNLKAQKIHTSDINNFWIAFDSVQKADGDRNIVFKNLYIDKGTDGLKAFMKIRNFNEKDYIEAIEKYPKFWNSIRPNTSINGRQIKNLNSALKKFKKLYPNNFNGNIYYTVGALKSGGTVDGNNLLLGIEKIVGNRNTIVSEFESKNLQNMFRFSNPSQLEHITVHEFVHTFQKEGELNVLSKAIKEGSCDFISELALNEKFASHYIDYGYKHYDLIRSAFKKVMFSQDFRNWFYNIDRNDTPDLGYFVGYVISKKYYERAKDKKQAIKDIIDLDYNAESELVKFLEKSNYFEEKINVEDIKGEYKRNQPKVAKIIGFENGGQDIKPNLKQIQIVFSKPMNDKISINFSKSGKDHFPLKNIVGFNNDKTILTLQTVELKPDTDYDFYITDRSTQSVDGFSFIESEYKISFKTGNK